jgi:hypothetical protein
MRRIRKTLIGVTVVAGLLAPAAVAAQPSAAVSPGQPALAHDKSKSPPTDLQHYPKRKTAPQPSATSVKPAAGRVDKEVVVREALPGGITRQISYTPAKGVTPQQLAAKLQKKGVNAKLVSPAEASGGVSTFSGLCAYGIARTDECPATYWRNNGWDDPQVYFVDHTSAQWPVDAAVYDWNQAWGIDSYYSWNTCPGYGGARCYHVWSGNYGDTDWAGQAVQYWDTATRAYIDGWGYIQLNDYHEYWGNYSTRSVACHEVGHVLGLGHAVGGASCMNPYASDYPHSDDFGMLADIYSIYR